MQIIIDIPEDIYQYVANTGTYGHYRFDSARVIRNGTPLDKIKDEIEQLPITDTAVRLVLEVIDKYKIKSKGGEIDDNA